MFWKESPTHTVKWMNLEDFTPSEINLSLKDKYCRIPRKKSGWEGAEAYNELQEICSTETQECSSRWPKTKSKMQFLKKGSRSEEEHHAPAVCQEERSKDISQLVQEGRFLEACETISRSAVEKQDCGSQYQAVAQGMWQVVQEALSGSERSRQLQPKLQSVMAAVNWAENFEGPKPSTLQGGGLAAWDSQLQSLLRKDAEARLPGPVSGAELSGYLEELGKAVEHVLGPQLEGRLGVCFLALYRVCFQEVLCSHLSVLLSSSGEDRKNYYKLYTWGRATLFGHREMRQKAPPASKEPTAARRLLDPVMFVTWMFQVQEKLLELIQKELKDKLERVLIYDRRSQAESSYKTFLEIFQLLNETIVVGRDIGPPISSRVRIMVVGTFLEFLNRYQEEGAPSFIQLHASAGTFPQLHVLENCCILRKTWEALVQEGPVQGIINSIEVWSQDDLLSRVRALFQSLLEHHFSTRNDDLVQALQSLQQALKGCSNMHSTPTYKVLVKSLYMVVLGEYVHALVTYLKTLEPGVWADREGQVKKEVLELDTIFGEREQDVGDRMPCWETIKDIFQLRQNRGRESLHEWLASFRDKFPGYVREDQPRSSSDSDKRSCCCLQLWTRGGAGD
ncbi:uncharacterized protein LOC106728552 isoform X3 [Camelus ferus]|uniref:Uncharacterized protein LOC106728552 isoform X3 n=1 Tax=Camelus ferus TaxID=419612 RepID=A0A8B7K3R5_CAMFR|nr:uncharacterized protein LOC106728552 isoform X3 [Camelus ferus]